MKPPGQSQANERLAAIITAHDIYSASRNPEHRDQLHRALLAYWHAIRQIPDTQRSYACSTAAR
jgi:hypothetical protein